jgi:hypothetical protein
MSNFQYSGAVGLYQTSYRNTNCNNTAKLASVHAHSLVKISLERVSLTSKQHQTLSFTKYDKLSSNPYRFSMATNIVYLASYSTVTLANSFEPCDFCGSTQL